MTDNITPVAWRYRYNGQWYLSQSKTFAMNGLDLQPLFASPQPARETELVRALEMLLHAVCHETGFAAAVRAESGVAYPWPPLDEAEAFARTALRARCQP